MTDTILVAPDSLWSDGQLLTGQALEVSRGRVSRLRPLGTDTPDARPMLVSAGLTDLQVNGGGGVMLNGDPSPEGLTTIAAAHRRLGTHAILPTVITDTPEVTEAAAEAVLATKGAPGLLGLHIEGPHISLARRGTHKEAFIRPLDTRTVALVERLRAADLPVMITLAPEAADPDLLARLVSCGAVVSAGHSIATAAETRAALAAGVTCFTHLYNAMPPMTSRDPGLLGTALMSDAYAGIICDGIHVDWTMLRLALACRPRRDRTFAVSDAMSTVGGPDHFTLYGQTITVRDGALVNAEGSLAGAHVDLVTSLANLVRHADQPLAQALAMVTDTPRAALGLAPQRIAPGQPIADLVALDSDFALIPLAV